MPLWETLRKMLRKERKMSRISTIDPKNLEIAIEKYRAAMEVNPLPVVALLDRCLYTIRKKERRIIELDSAMVHKVEVLQKEIERLNEEVARLEAGVQ